MVRLTRTAALTAFACNIMFSAAAASDNLATTSPETDKPDWLAHESLSLTIVNSATPNLQYPVLPLTSGMGLNASSNSNRVRAICIGTSSKPLIRIDRL